MTGHVFARKTNGQLGFLCSNCGKFHRHGAGEGHRVSHCDTSSYNGFGIASSGYEILESDQVDGSLTGREAKSIQVLSNIALSNLSSILELLKAANIPKNAPIVGIVSRAERAVGKILGVGTDLNPISMATNEQSIDLPEGNY